jgi:hypothetical protein
MEPGSERGKVLVNFIGDYSQYYDNLTLLKKLNPATIPGGEVPGEVRRRGVEGQGPQA